jgi:hypothetical protein
MAASHTHPPRGTLRLTQRGWRAHLRRTLDPASHDEYGPNPCPGTGRGCGVRTMNLLCHFCTRTMDRR